MAVEGNLKKIVPTDKTLNCEIQKMIDGKTKPRGSLGLLEEIALKMSLIQGNSKPEAERKGILLFAADHGVTAEGVSAYPAEVTPQMVMNILEGGAAINAFCRTGGIQLGVIDVGVDFDFPPGINLTDFKIRKGTGNFVQGPAMSGKEAESALEAGRRAFRKMYNEYGVQLLGLGEMGIGNTTSAAAITSIVTGEKPEKIVGRGTGLDDAGVKRKIKVVDKALAFHGLETPDGIEILQAVGGFEIGAMAGAALEAASMKTAVVFDGFISTAAGLIAHKIDPDIKDYAFSGHRSIEAGQKAALEFLELEPIIDYRMRLGEGTGAALAMHTIDCSCAFLRDMASFDEAGVSREDH